MGEPARIIDTADVLDVSSMLEQAAEEQPKPKSKKSSVPVYTGHEDLADQAHAALAAAKQKETEAAIAKKEAIAIGRRLYDEQGETGNFASSVALAGATTPGIVVGFQDRWDDLDPAAAKPLREHLGEQFAVLFDERRQLVVRKTDDATIREVIGALGPDRFKEIFSISVSYQPKKGMARQQFSLPAEVRGTLVQKSTSVKLR